MRTKSAYSHIIILWILCDFNSMITLRGMFLAIYFWLLNIYFYWMEKDVPCAIMTITSGVNLGNLWDILGFFSF